MKKYEITEEELQAAFWFALVNGIELDKGRTWAKDFLKSKSEIKYLDKEEIKDCLLGFAQDSGGGDWCIYIDEDNIDEAINDICSLAIENKPVKYLSREEVEMVFDLVLPIAWNYQETKDITMTDQENIIDKICSLAIPDFDSYTSMPPNESYEVDLIVDKIEKGKPSICDEIENVAIKGEVVAEGEVTMPWENAIVYPEIPIEKMQEYVGKKVRIIVEVIE